MEHFGEPGQRHAQRFVRRLQKVSEFGFKSTHERISAGAGHFIRTLRRAWDVFSIL
ncbi:hypothetical protein [Flavobacterium chungangense]|uniref:hypothetical protein n=1 Tax=Flavobacterium chungangense TaxID=554283 RepID=UPI000A613E94|nr:hypothetical protein [Flavobacterium chungangense]